MKQATALDKILKSLISTLEEDYQTNEATLKNNFFYHLRINNPAYQITVEENLNNHIKLDGRADFYLNDTSTKSYKDDIVIEFKINCTNKNLINHDINKLEKINIESLFKNKSILNTNLIYNLLNNDSNNHNHTKKIQILPAYPYNSNNMYPDLTQLSSSAPPSVPINMQIPSAPPFSQYHNTQQKQHISGPPASRYFVN